MLALLGSNGSGKTTVVRVCSGLLKPTTGSLLYDGDDITGFGRFDMARIGILHAPEGRSVFGSLTVEENLAAHVPSGVRSQWRQGGARQAYELFPRSVTAGDRSPARSPVASSGCSRSPACSCASRSSIITDELSLGLAP